MKTKMSVSIPAVLALLVVILFVSAQPAYACEVGCTPGFWKQDQHFDNWEVYSPDDKVVDVFANAAAYVDSGDTLLDALNYHGGNGADGSARILLRAATATLLNTAYDSIHGGWGYASWLPPGLLIAIVDQKLGWGDRAPMLDLADTLDGYNNKTCPL